MLSLETHTDRMLPGDPKDAAQRILGAVELSRALVVSRRSPSRSTIWELRLECYTYPLPRWEPGELERRGLK